jgi:hypothetical protein
MRNCFAMLPAIGLLLACPVAHALTDWSQVDAALGRKGVVLGAVHKYGIPRSDLQVTLDGVEIRPGLALGGWIAFEPMGDREMMMGDLVLTEAEVNPVMSALLENGVEVTGAHNHLLRASPATLYMHVAGRGDPVQLANAVRSALAQSRTPLPGRVQGAPAPLGAGAAVGFDLDAVERIIGFKGQNNGGVYQFSIPRGDVIRMEGMTLSPAMGTAIALNFEPTGAGKAAASGDFVAHAGEVQPLLKALRANGIEVTALHNHMLGEEPRAFFVHFWANQDAVKLAQGLRAGLDVLNIAASSQTH